MPEGESYQRDRVAPRRERPAGRPGLDPLVAMLFRAALNRPDADRHTLWRLLGEAAQADDGGAARIEQLAAQLGLRDVAATGT